MNLTGWADAAWADGSWVPESWGVSETPQATPEVVARGRSGSRRYRIIGDLDELIEEIKVEEKAVEKSKKKLKILQKKQVAPEGIYKDFEPQIQAVEKSIDTRLQRIVELQMLISQGLEDDEDEEEVFLMS